ncbi:hypothetical protein [Allokutzneria oryzae]|uniref:DNA-binding protein n=1 Tax=Allokutzneria oryzae TaxID=1378989 RepID=A0ABV5ZQM1_9PSEU
MAISVNLNSQLDKAYERLSLAEILAAPVSAVAGITPADAEKLNAAFGIKTVRDLGSNKFIKLAVALVELDQMATR